jgi:hypothetical protein
MNLLTAVIYAFIALCFIALAFYLIEWVLNAIGIAVPAMVITVLKVILILIAVLVLVHLFGPLVSADLGRLTR